MGVKERREREKSNTRQRILDAARELFVRDGQVTMRAIADAAEYSPTAIYVHFADKEALLTELATCDFRAFTAQFGAVPDDLGPLARLELLGRNYVRFAQEYPSQYRHLFMTPKQIVPHAHPPEEDAYAILTGAVAAAVAAGVFHPDHHDVDRIAQTLWMTLHGACAMHLTMPTGGKVQLVPLDVMAEHLIGMLFVAFTQPAPPTVASPAP